MVLHIKIHRIFRYGNMKINSVYFIYKKKSSVEIIYIFFVFILDILHIEKEKRSGVYTPRHSPWCYANVGLVRCKIHTRSVQIKFYSQQITRKNSKVQSIFIDDNNDLLCMSILDDMWARQQLRYSITHD